MTIRLIFGNVGSGKTASMVRYMIKNKHKNFITNIEVKGKDTGHIMKLTGSMIVKREVIGHKRDGTEIKKLSLNSDFWKNLIEEKKEMNVVIDEAHIFFNPRRSMSQMNRISTDFLALLRRVLGSMDNNSELILISQLSRRLDIIAKEMATRISFCVCHYKVRCSRCKSYWTENNEMGNKNAVCPRCNDYRLTHDGHVIEIFEFKNIDDFLMFKENGIKTYYDRYLIYDINKIFKNYNSLQFDDMMSEYY